MRSTGRVIWCGRIGRKERIGHHLETRVNEASSLRDKGLDSAAWTGEAGLLREDEIGTAETRRRSKEAILLIDSEQIG